MVRSLLLTVTLLLTGLLPAGGAQAAEVPSIADERFVAAAYVGLVGREPDAAGQSYWGSRLGGGGLPSTVLAAIGDSNEHRRKVVSDAYVAILGREPDAGGHSYWSDGLIDQRSERQLHAELFASAEYYAAVGSTPGSFVEAIYRDALTRVADEAGLAYWSSLLTSGASRLNVARTLLALPEAALQPDLGIVDASPLPDRVSPSLDAVRVTLYRPIIAARSAILVSVDGTKLPGGVTAGRTDTELVFTATRRPAGIAAGQRAHVVVTVLAYDGTEVDRTDYSFVYQPGSTGGSRNELIVAFYGHAKTPVLGVMGEGTPTEAAQRLLTQAEPYRVDGRPVVPAFELIATLATAAPGERNTYSARTDLALIQPYLDAIRVINGRLILDIQPGRADFETEARFYEPLLLQPEVGLALDPEWAVGPNETPAGNVGSLDAAEINRVSAHLSNLVVTNGLPDKLLVIHRFRPDMVTNTDAIVTHPGVVILFQADGEGSPPPKIADYNTLLPPRFARGMKVFYDEDTQRMSPADVLALDPAPDYVSYQ